VSAGHLRCSSDVFVSSSQTPGVKRSLTS